MKIHVLHALVGMGRNICNLFSMSVSKAQPKPDQDEDDADMKPVPHGVVIDVQPQNAFDNDALSREIFNRGNKGDGDGDDDGDGGHHRRTVTVHENGVNSGLGKVCT